MSEQNTEEIRNVPADMTETAPAETAEAAPAPAKEGEALSRKRRTALVVYLAVLFAVAFLLVALSLVVENRHLQSASEQTSASLNGRIAELQNEYAKLQGQNSEMETRIAGLENEAAARQTELEALQQQLAEKDREKEDLIREKSNLAVEREIAVKKAQDVLKAHELLFAAQAADEEGNFARLQELMEELAPLRYLLCPTARDIYESLIIA